MSELLPLHERLAARNEAQQERVEEQQELALPETHGNIRGPAYYH